MFANISVLVIEDDAHSLVSITALLKELGVHYKRNTTGMEVIPQLWTMIPKPNLILLDLDLPAGDSLALSQAIHGRTDLAAIPIVALGRHPLAYRQTELEAAGFAGFIRKPLPHNHFGALLAKILAGQPVWEFD